ncbi:hypothetical protein CEXT_484111 [Caerostris extrusa]|uniref:Uncharacterized protein n=1 Tax=Caerostris extrusa TaxID=172846 RepID=A0AAV4NX22_CAEEX|nr:hypothetical protein CEXT_484111 [Caerostris extrusa]
MVELFCYFSRNRPRCTAMPAHFNMKSEKRDTLISRLGHHSLTFEMEMNLRMTSAPPTTPFDSFLRSRHQNIA